MIDPLSVVPLHIEPVLNGKKVADATGFIVERDGRRFVITNWHVVTGRHPDTNQPLDAATGIADPTDLAVWPPARDRFGTWERLTIRLLDADTGTRFWTQDDLGRHIDVVAIPIELPDRCTCFPMDMSLADSDIAVSPSEAVSIIGFPYGMTAGGKFPIWKTGHVATDLDLDYLGKPIFLIDATTRPSMSGSPVVAKRVGSYATRGGGLAVGSATRFLGLYSGRMNENIDASIGFVWKPSAIAKVLTKAMPAATS